MGQGVYTKSATNVKQNRIMADSVFGVPRDTTATNLATYLGAPVGDSGRLAYKDGNLWVRNALRWVRVGSGDIPGWDSTLNHGNTATRETYHQGIGSLLTSPKNGLGVGFEPTTGAGIISVRKVDGTPGALSLFGLQTEINNDLYLNKVAQDGAPVAGKYLGINGQGKVILSPFPAFNTIYNSDGIITDFQRTVRTRTGTALVFRDSASVSYNLTLNQIGANITSGTASQYTELAQNPNYVQLQARATGPTRRSGLIADIDSIQLFSAGLYRPTLSLNDLDGTIKSSAGNGASNFESYMRDNGMEWGTRLSGTYTLKAKLFTDGRMQGAPAVNLSEFATLGQLRDSVKNIYNSDGVISGPDNLRRIYIPTDKSIWFEDQPGNMRFALSATAIQQYIYGPTAGTSTYLYENQYRINSNDATNGLTTELEVTPLQYRLRTGDANNRAEIRATGGSMNINTGGYTDYTYTEFGNNGLTIYDVRPATPSGAEKLKFFRDGRLMINGAATQTGKNLRVLGNTDLLGETRLGMEGRGYIKVSNGNSTIETGNIGFFQSDGTPIGYIVADVSGMFYTNQNNGGHVFTGANVRIENRLSVGNTTAAAANSTLQVKGSIAIKQRTITATTVLDENDATVYVSPASNTVITIPAASTCEGRVIEIFRKSAGVQTLDIVSAGGSINGMSTVSLANQYSFIIIKSDGANWFIFSPTL